MGEIGRTNWHTGVRRFMDPGDETSGIDQITKSRGEIRTIQYRRTHGGEQSNWEISRKERSSIVKSRIGKSGIPWKRGPIHFDSRNPESR
jgi:hypothetical protein